MKTRGLDGQVHNWKLHGYVVRASESRPRSKLHLKARTILKDIFPTVQILEEVAELAQGNEREFWFRQLAETLAAAAQEGTMPDALAQLERLSERLPVDDPLKSFLAFRLASARYASSMQ